jgi:hypothetical protein
MLDHRRVWVASLLPCGASFAADTALAVEVHLPVGDVSSVASE